LFFKVFFTEKKYFFFKKETTLQFKTEILFRKKKKLRLLEVPGISWDGALVGQLYRDR